LGLIPGVGLVLAFPDFYPGAKREPSDLIALITTISAVFNSLFSYVALPLAAGDCAGFYLGYVSRTNNFFLAANAAPGNIAQLSPVDATRLATRLSALNSFLRQLPSLVIQPAIAATAANNQKIGLLEFDTFHPSDVQDWLALLHANPTFADRLSEVPVNGGAGSPGAGQSEVLLDIATVMLADPSPNTSYVVYDAPRSTTFQQLFNAMINDGVTVISNSWTECEDQHTLADVQSIDSVLAQAAASGISVFNGSGDTGTTCLDGSPNTVGVPANSPHATAVGGTTPNFGPGFTYGGETWWNGSGELPPTGQGGFGVSRYFPRPAYQNGLTTSAMRSVPDVVVDADPRAGLSICQADAGGCPTGLLYGGTSMAAPMMAGMVAYLNEILGSNIGEVNPVIYPLAGTNVFHSAASMGADFAHVGLGSPKFDYLLVVLSNHQIGPVDPSMSRAGGTLLPAADGTTPAILRVDLTDANHFPVAGKSVNLTPNAGSHAIVSAPSGPSDDTNGAVTFTITDTTPETVTFTVTDTTDGIVLQQTPSITFVVPPATSAGISASPNHRDR
jgi:Bacterial Ig-like domain (group 1)/Subtilase family